MGRKRKYFTEKEKRGEFYDKKIQDLYNQVDN